MCAATIIHCRAKSAVRGPSKAMTNQVLVPPPDLKKPTPIKRAPVRVPTFSVLQVEKSTWQSLLENLRDFFFPIKLPPLKLTSRPIPVKSPYGTYGRGKVATTLSLFLHILAIGGILAMSLTSAKVVQEVKNEEHVT